MTSGAKILVATEVLADADVVRKLLQAEFDDVVVSSASECAIEDFERQRPNILILAFNTIEKSQRYYLGLLRRSRIVHALPHRTIILCNKDDVPSAYDLCKNRYFDDYMLFWPMAHDTVRLRMAVHQGLWSLQGLETAGHAPATILAQARPLLDLGTRLEQFASQGREHIDAAAHQLRHSPGQLDEALRPVSAWVESTHRAFESELRAASALQRVAENTRPLVLFVDDDEFQHKLFRQIVRDKGLEIVFAGSGSEALATVARRRPQLIVLDVNLPDIDGIEITRRLKEVEHLADIPVVMITGRSGKNVVVNSLKAGAVDFVVKPFDRDTLLAKIDAVLSIRGYPRRVADS